MTDQSSEATIIPPEQNKRRPGEYTDAEHDRLMRMEKAMWPCLWGGMILLLISAILGMLRFLNAAGFFFLLAVISEASFVLLYSEIVRVSKEKHAEKETAARERSRKFQEENEKAQMQRTLERIWQKQKSDGWTIENHLTFIKTVVEKPEWVEHVNKMMKLDLTPNPPLANIEKAEAWVRKRQRIQERRKKLLTADIIVTLIAGAVIWYFLGDYWPAAALVVGIGIGVLIFKLCEDTIAECVKQENAWREKFEMLPYKCSVPPLADYGYEIPRGYESTTNLNRIHMVLEYMTHLQYDEIQKHFRRFPTRSDLNDAIKVFVYPVILELEMPVFRCAATPLLKSEEPPEQGIVIGRGTGL